MGKIKRMDQVRQIIEAYIATNSLKATARRLQISKNTVKAYIRLGKAYNEDLSQLLSLSEPELLSIFYPSKDGEPSAADRSEVFQSKVAYWIKELRKVGVTRHLLWQEYRLSQPQGFQYSWFCEHYRAWQGKLDVVMRQEHRVGEKLFVDYAGQTVPVIDRHSGEIRQAQVFVAVLGASSYTFAEATWSQQLPDWLGSHIGSI